VARVAVATPLVAGAVVVVTITAVAGAFRLQRIAANPVCLNSRGPGSDAAE
jgi:hypothetical protein